MRVERIVGRVWKIVAKSEKNEEVYVHVVSDTPEQALASFRDQYPGHDVDLCVKQSADAVIVPA